MTKLFLNQLILRNKYLVKIFSILFFLLLVFLFIYGAQLFSTSQAKESLEETVVKNFEDEIQPFCNGLNYFDDNKFEYFDLSQLEIDIYDDLGWNTNVFKIISSGDRVINPEYKEKFNGNLIVHVKNENKNLNFKCLFEIEIRISGDWTDHINKKNGMTSLDVKLLSGNIDGITKFKLFAPISRNYENEVYVTTLLETIGFLSPRTSLVDVFMDDFNGKQIHRRKMIFQEKFSKEMIEYYGFREGPLIETDESLRWTTIIENNFDEPDKRYFMPAKVLNKYWSRKSQNNQKITLEALELYNKAIFSSNKPWTQLNYNFLGSNPNLIYKFDAALMALESIHAITNHQRKFYFNKIENQFYPIYYDGNSFFLWETAGTKPEVVIRPDYENLEDLSIAAGELLNELNVDEELFKQSLEQKGVELTSEEIKYFNNKFRRFLKNISEDSRSNMQNGINYYSDPNLLKTLKLPEREVEVAFVDIDNSIYEICNYDLTNCEIFKLDISSLDIFSITSSTNPDSLFIFGKSKTSFLNDNISSDKVINLTPKVKLITYGDVAYSLNSESKTLDIELLDGKSKAKIMGPGELANWKIKVFSESLNPEIIRNDQNLLTGCLTFYNVEFKNVVIEASNQVCEDAVNLVNTRGNIDSISISSSVSDGLDIDFSNIYVSNITIKDSFNDCLDLSGGSYFIESIVLAGCDDKGISIGETSEVKIDNVLISKTKIGVAIKDSSSLDINEANIDSSNYCFALYRKKQEFGPSYLSTGKINCDLDNDLYIQKGSVVNLDD